jgi:nitrogen-specific signal transduction histidine kinase
VARAVAEEHGGRLSWQRHEGRTRFSLCLPLTAADLPREGAEP